MVWQVGALLPALLCVAVAAASAAAVADSTECRMTPMSFDRQRSGINVGRFSIVIEQPDSSEHPSAWEGPLRVQDRISGKICAIDPGSLIERPLLAFGGHMLAVVTYSGSNYRIVSVDLAACDLAMTSEKVSGPVEVEDGRISADGKPLSGFPCAVLRE